MSDSTSDSDVSSLNWISSLFIPLTVPWSPWFPELNGSVKHLRPCRLVWCWNGIMAFGEPQICKAFRGLEKTAVSFFSMDSSKTGMETVIGPFSPEPLARAPKNIVTPSWAELNPKKPVVWNLPIDSDCFWWIAWPGHLLGAFPVWGRLHFAGTYRGGHWEDHCGCKGGLRRYLS